MITLEKIYQFSKTAPFDVAIQDESHCVNWQELEASVCQKVAFLLDDLKVEKHYQACFISKNNLELISWLAAFSTLGIPCVGLDYTLSADNLLGLVLEIKPAILLISSEVDDACAGLKSLDTYYIRLESPLLSFKDESCIQASLARWRDIPNQFRSIGLTSGTTGKPKVVLRSKSFDQRRFDYFKSEFGFSNQDVFLLSLPLYHAAGNGWARLFMSLGAKVIIGNPDNPCLLASHIATQGVTASVMTPSLIDSVVDEFRGFNLTGRYKLRWLLVGGKHFPAPQKKKALSVMGPVVYEYYGTTETGVNTLATPNDISLFPTSVGKAFDGNKVKIVDSANIELENYGIGTVAIHSYMNMDGYASSQADMVVIDDDMYLKTAEKGYLDDEGRLYLLSRSQCSTSLASIYRLEDKIREIPHIVDVAITQGDLDHEVFCVVILSVESRSQDRVLGLIKSLAASERIRIKKICMTHEIPYSPSGKVRINDLNHIIFAQN